MMSTTKIIQAARACADLIHREWRGNHTKPVAARTDADKTAAHLIERDRAGHLLFMCNEIERMIAEPDGPVGGPENRPGHTVSTRDKAMRWLGFVQGALWAGNLATIAELKRMNMPETGALGTRSTRSLRHRGEEK